MTIEDAAPHSEKDHEMHDEENALTRGQTMGAQESSRTAGEDGGSQDDYADEAILRRIFARYYGHIEELGIQDADRRAQFALDLGFLIGFAFRSVKHASSHSLPDSPGSPVARYPSVPNGEASGQITITKAAGR